MQRTQSRIERVKGHLRLNDRLVPHFLIKSDLAHGKEGLNIIFVLGVLGESALHVARLDSLDEALFHQILIGLLRDYSVWETFEAEGFELRFADESSMWSFRVSKRTLGSEQVFVHKELFNVRLVKLSTSWDVANPRRGRESGIRKNSWLAGLMCSVGYREAVLDQVGKIEESKVQGSRSDVKLTQFSFRIFEVLCCLLDEDLIEISMVARIAQKQVQEVNCPNVDWVRGLLIFCFERLFWYLFVVNVFCYSSDHLGYTQAFNVVLSKLTCNST